MKSETDGSTAEDSPSPFRQAASPSQPWMQSASSDCHIMDLQTLESSFGRLSVFDSSVDYRLLSSQSGAYRFPPESQNQLLSHCFNRSYVNAAQTSTSHVPFGSNSWRSNQVSDLSPSLVWLAKDRTSYKQLQQMIATGPKETVDMIFNRLIFDISDLMVDPFGHHVILELLQRCSSQQITQILLTITKTHLLFVTICIDSLGTRAIQSLLRCLHSEDQILHIVHVISMVALTLTRSNNAKHVILQCFQHFSPSQNSNLLEVIARYCYRIATDQHGCCMLQLCLGLGCDRLKHRLIDEIISNALKLCVDCYGNYVVQYVLEMKDPHVTGELVRQLIGHYGYLSRNKYGSHAVQRFLEINYIDSRVIVYDLLKEIDTLLVDPYGNYVIQTAWIVSKDEMRNILLWHIHNNIQLMTYNKFGRKILEILNV